MFGGHMYIVVRGGKYLVDTFIVVRGGKYLVDTCTRCGNK